MNLNRVGRVPGESTRVIVNEGPKVKSTLYLADKEILGNMNMAVNAVDHNCAFNTDETFLGLEQLKGLTVAHLILDNERQTTHFWRWVQAGCFGVQQTNRWKAAVKTDILGNDEMLESVILRETRSCSVRNS